MPERPPAQLQPTAGVTSACRRAFAAADAAAAKRRAHAAITPLSRYGFLLLIERCFCRHVATSAAVMPRRAMPQQMLRCRRVRDARRLQQDPIAQNRLISPLSAGMPSPPRPPTQRCLSMP